MTQKNTFRNAHTPSPAQAFNKSGKCTKKVEHPEGALRSCFLGVLAPSPPCLLGYSAQFPLACVALYRCDRLLAASHLILRTCISFTSCFQGMQGRSTRRPRCSGEVRTGAANERETQHDIYPHICTIVSASGPIESRGQIGAIAC